MKLRFIPVALIGTLSLIGCDVVHKVEDLKYLSPIGGFIHNEYKIIVKPDKTYDLCQHGQCVSGHYVPLGDGGKTLRLIDFYNSQIGLDLEKLAVENGYMDHQLDTAIEHRKKGSYPNDLVFSASDYCDVPCFFLGDYYSEGLFFKLD